MRLVPECFKVSQEFLPKSCLKSSFDPFLDNRRIWFIANGHKLQQNRQDLFLAIFYDLFQIAPTYLDEDFLVECSNFYILSLQDLSHLGW